jgi:two-component system phosphate regulon sensor histidine kinase PhoR
MVEMHRLRRAWLAFKERQAPEEPQAPPSAVTGKQVVETLISALPFAAIALSDATRVMAFNAQAFSIAPALSVGSPALIALRMPELVDAIRSATVNGQQQRVEIVERVLHRWFEVFVTPARFDPTESGDQPDLLLIIFNDLGPLRRVEEMRADFVASASHELRTPLAALLGFIETMQGPAHDDPVARDRFLGIMREQAWRMARLIDDLLSLSRIELRAHMRPDTPVDLVAIVGQVVDGLQTLAQDRGVAISIADVKEPLPVLGDRDELLRLFENLIENALKYGASGRRVDVTPARLDALDGRHEASVSVRDYGPGIAAEHLPRLTERFYRVDVGESRAQGGTGLGLALVKHILNRHQGRLSIESRTGKGATFTVRLPLAENK